MVRRRHHLTAAARRGSGGRDPGPWRRAGALLAVLAACLGACRTATVAGPAGSPSEEPPLAADGPAPVPDLSVAGPFADAPPQVIHYAALNRSLGDTLRGAGAGCERVAQALDRWTRVHGEAFRQATVAMDAWERRADRDEARHYHEQMTRDVDARVGAGVRCDRHPGARAAFDRFFVAAGFDGH